MATDSWTFAIDHQSDAGFRLWGADLNAKLAAIGLIQTADTGQINWVTVTRPAVSTNAGYEIWRFNDAQQGAAPIFIRIDFGTGASAARPRMQISTGTGSSGAGVLTGTITAVATASAGAGTATGATLTSYLCYAEGFLGLVHGANGAATGLAYSGFIINRSCDADGVPDATGFLRIYAGVSTISTTPGNQSVRLAATAQVFTAGAVQLICVPGHESNSLVGADNQAFVSFGIFPRALPMNGLCAMFLAELAEGSTMSTALVGATPRTYLSIGRQMGTMHLSNTITQIGECMLWE